MKNAVTTTEILAVSIFYFLEKYIHNCNIFPEICQSNLILLNMVKYTEVLKTVFYYKETVAHTNLTLKWSVARALCDVNSRIIHLYFTLFVTFPKLIQAFQDSNLNI